MANNVKLLTDNYIYFYHLDKFCVIPVYPDSITDTMQSSFSETNALSRSAPVFTYKNSGPRTIVVTLNLHRDLMNDINTNVSNLKSNVIDFKDDDYVDTLIKYLQSISLPRYNSYASGAKSVIPPMVAIRFGNDIFIKGIVNGSVQVTYKKPILSGGKYACVDVTFTVSESDPYDADTIVDQGSFRGITSTFRDGIYRTNSNVSKSAKSTGNKSGAELTNYVVSEYANTQKVSKQTASDVSYNKIKEIA